MPTAHVPLVIYGVSPPVGSAGTTLTISASAVPTNATVTFNGYSVAISGGSGSNATVVVPPLAKVGATPGVPVNIAMHAEYAPMNCGGDSDPKKLLTDNSPAVAGFRYADGSARPVVTGVVPTFGVAGSGSVRINGTGFGKYPCVQFGTDGSGCSKIVPVNPDGTLTASVPSGAGQVGVTVYTGGGGSWASDATQFTFVAPMDLATDGLASSTGGDRVDSFRTDMNGFPHNPLWGFEGSGKGATSNDPGTYCNAGFSAGPACTLDKREGWDLGATCTEVTVACQALGSVSRSCCDNPCACGGVLAAASIVTFGLDWVTDFLLAASALACADGRTVPYGDSPLVPQHQNWQPVTYEGTIYWEGHSSGAFESWMSDSDYNFRFVGANGVAATYHNDVIDASGHESGGPSVNANTLHPEFNSPELASHFDEAGGWWQAFNAAAQGSGAGAKIDGHPAVVTGMLGLDCEHGCKAELHPLFSMAIETNSSASEDTWAVMAKDWGDEGACSTQTHYAGGGADAKGPTDWTIGVPWCAGATDVTARWVNGALSGASPTVDEYKAPGQAYYFTIHFTSRADAGPYFVSELHLNWTGAGTTCTHASSARAWGGSPGASPAPAPAIAKPAMEIEDLFDKMFARMTPVQRAAFDQRMKQVARPTWPSGKATRVAPQVQRAGRSGLGRPLAIGHSEPWQDKVALDSAVRDALRAAYTRPCTQQKPCAGKR